MNNRRMSFALFHVFAVVLQSSFLMLDPNRSTKENLFTHKRNQCNETGIKCKQIRNEISKCMILTQVHSLLQVEGTETSYHNLASKVKKMSLKHII